MRFSIPILFCAFSVAALADTIHLRNGRTIVADEVKQKGERVEYAIGDDTYAIPKSLIDHIDTGVGTGVSSGGAASIAAPRVDRSKLADIAPDGRITQERLARAESLGNKNGLVEALLALAVQEQLLGKGDDARSRMDRAASIAPEDSRVSAIYAWLLLKQERASLAQGYAEQAVRLDNGSELAHKVLGISYYKNDQIQRALDEFKKAKQLDASDGELDSYLTASTRQLKAEADFRTAASTHFNLRYEGDKASPQLREQILTVLERHFGDLVSTMGVLPRDPISVVLYTNQSYFDVTEAPSWTAALNDGKLRIPVEGLTGVTSELSRVLKHELAHSFIRQASNGRCPVWLNEGLAQLLEPRSAAGYRTRVAQLFASGHQIPLGSLEGSFIGYSSSQAAMAYIESLAYVEYIRDSYGINRISDILRSLNDGESPEEALKSAIHDDYAQLEEEFGRHLR